MMIRRTLTLLALLTLAMPAQGLKMSVWDRELQTKLGDGESSGSRFSVRLVKDFEGPVVVLFALSDDEKARGSFPGLKSRYNGSLAGGELTLASAASERTLNPALTLAKFLTPFKLTLSVVPTGQSLSLPGLKTSGAQPR